MDLRGGRVSTAVRTPFVSTPEGEGVIEAVSAKVHTFTEFYVRLKDGTARWFIARECEFDVEQPDWYREPETSAIAGWVR